MSRAAGVADALVVGGGFFGTTIAAYLRRERGLERVTLVERGAALLERASYNNQARVHNGYHYPRSFTTAYRSRVNFPAFMRRWSDAVRDVVAIYAIARSGSKVTARQFERFCRDIGAALEPADAATRALFEPRLVEAVYRVEECVFDAARLAAGAARELLEGGVTVHLRTTARGVTKAADGTLRVAVESRSGAIDELRSRLVFNCTYSALNRLGGAFGRARTRLKHEIAELALVRVPPTLRGMGVTVMDGPFFSIMPFPDRGLHTLTHVRYTPHLQWQDVPEVDPYAKLEGYERATRVDRMMRDVERYLPSIRAAEYAGSLFEVKTVLQKNEGDDGRPILFETHPELPGCYSILGGKLDNVEDVLRRLDREPIGEAVAA